MKHTDYLRSNTYINMGDWDDYKNICKTLDKKVNEFEQIVKHKFIFVGINT